HNERGRCGPVPKREWRLPPTDHRRIGCTGPKPSTTAALVEEQTRETPVAAAATQPPTRQPAKRGAALSSNEKGCVSAESDGEPGETMETFPFFFSYWTSGRHAPA